MQSPSPSGVSAAPQPPVGTDVLKRSRTNKKIALLNINGIYYRSTGHKLQKQTTATGGTATTIVSPLPSRQLTARRPNEKLPPRSTTTKSSGLRIKIRGTQFMLEANGKKLRRIPDAASRNVPVATAVSHQTSSSLSRFDLGRITYVADGNSKNTWVRTDRHKTRAHLSGAKQKSIQVLARNLVKSNVPCAIYQRLGRCLRRERGRCNHIHDPKRVAICQKYSLFQNERAIAIVSNVNLFFFCRFLQGSCMLKDCLLSHTVSLAKMPVCKFFLLGMCSKTDCPYLHKKVNEKMDICPDFVKGYCELAEKVWSILFL